MEMGDALTAVVAGIHDDAVAPRLDSQGPRDFRGAAEKLPQQHVMGRVAIGQSRQVLAWQEENVMGRLGLEIADRDPRLLFAHNLRWKLFGDDSAEDTAHRTSPS